MIIKTKKKQNIKEYRNRITFNSDVQDKMIIFYILFGYNGQHIKKY